MTEDIKCMSGMLFQSDAMSCNVIQCIQGKHRLSHTLAQSNLLSCCDISPVFRLFQVVGEKWLSTTSGVRNSAWSFYGISSGNNLYSQNASEILFSPISILFNS